MAYYNPYLNYTYAKSYAEAHEELIKMMSLFTPEGSTPLILGEAMAIDRATRKQLREHLDRIEQCRAGIIKPLDWVDAAESDPYR